MEQLDRYALRASFGFVTEPQTFNSMSAVQSQLRGIESSVKRTARTISGADIGSQVGTSVQKMDKSVKTAAQDLTKFSKSTDFAREHLKALKSEFRALRAEYKSIDFGSDLTDDKQFTTARYQVKQYVTALKDLESQVHKDTTAEREFIAVLKTQGRQAQAGADMVEEQRKAAEMAGRAGQFQAVRDVGKSVFKKTTDQAKSAIKIFADFDSQMSAVEAVSEATDEQMGQLRKKAMALGASTRYTAKEAASAMEFLGQAGYKTEDILKTVGQTLNLASAGELELAEATSIATGVLAGFQMDVSQMGRVTDVLAKGAAATNTSVQGLGMALSYAAPNAALFGASIEETTAILGLMANAGIDATRGGTAMRSAYLRLAKPPKMAQAAIKELGIELVNQDGKMRDIVDIFHDIANATNLGSDTLKGLAGASGDSAEALEAVAGSSTASAKAIGQLNAIFGTEAVSGVAAVLQQVSSLDELNTTLNKAKGSGAKMAEVMEDNLGGSFRALSSAMEALQLNFIEPLTPLIRLVIDTTTKFFLLVANLPMPVRTLIAVVGGLTVGLAALAVVIGTVGALFAGFAQALATVNTAALALQSGALIPLTGFFETTLTASIATNPLVGLFNTIRTSAIKSVGPVSLMAVRFQGLIQAALALATSPLVTVLLTVLALSTLLDRIAPDVSVLGTALSVLIAPLSFLTGLLVGFVKGILAFIGTDIGRTVKLIGSPFGTITKALSQVIATFKHLEGTGEEVGQNLAKFILSPFALISDYVGERWNRLINFLQGKLQGFVNFTKIISGFLITNLSSASPGLTTWIQGKWESLIEVISALLVGLVGTAASIGHAIVDVFDSMGQSIGHVFDTQIIDRFKNARTGVKDYVAGEVDRLAKIEAPKDYSYAQSNEQVTEVLARKISYRTPEELKQPQFADFLKQNQLEVAQSVQDDATGFSATLLKSLKGEASKLLFAGTDPSTFIDVREDVTRVIGGDQFEKNKQVIADMIAQGVKEGGRKIDVIGHSLGGALAQSTAAEFTDQIGTVTTFNAPAISPRQVKEYKKHIAALQQTGEGTIPTVQHNVEVGDIVSTGGGEFIPGQVDFFTHQFDSLAKALSPVTFLTNHLEYFFEETKQFKRVTTSTEQLNSAFYRAGIFTRTLSEAIRLFLSIVDSYARVLLREFEFISAELTALQLVAVTTGHAFIDLFVSPQKAGEEFASAINFLLSAISAFYSIGGQAQRLKPLGEILYYMADNLYVFVGGLAVLAASRIINLISAPIKAIRLLWIDLVHSITSYSNQIKAPLVNSFSVIYSTIESFVTGVGRILYGLFKGVTTVGLLVFQVASSIAGAVGSTLSFVFSKIIGLTNDAAFTEISVMRSFAGAILNIAVALVRKVFDVVQWVATTTFNTLKGIYDFVVWIARSIGNVVWNITKSISNALWGFVQQNFGGLFRWIGKSLSNIGQSISNFVSGIANSVWSSVVGFVTKLDSLFQEIAIYRILRTEVGLIIVELATLYERYVPKLQNAITALGQSISGTFNSLKTGIKDTFNYIANAVNFTIRVIGELFTDFPQAIADIKAGFHSAINDIKTGIQSLKQITSDTIHALVDGVVTLGQIIRKTVVTTILNPLAEGFRQISRFIKLLLTDPAAAIKELVDAAKQLGQQAFNIAQQVFNAAKWVFDGIVYLVSDTFSVLFRWIKTVLNSIYQFLIAPEVAIAELAGYLEHLQVVGSRAASTFGEKITGAIDVIHSSLEGLRDVSSFVAKILTELFTSPSQAVTDLGEGLTNVVGRAGNAMNRIRGFMAESPPSPLPAVASLAETSVDVAPPPTFDQFQSQVKPATPVTTAVEAAVGTAEVASPSTLSSQLDNQIEPVTLELPIIVDSIQEQEQAREQAKVAVQEQINQTLDSIKNFRVQIPSVGDAIRGIVGIFAGFGTLIGGVRHSLDLLGRSFDSTLSAEERFAARRELLLSPFIGVGDAISNTMDTIVNAARNVGAVMDIIEDKIDFLGALAILLGVMAQVLQVLILPGSQLAQTLGTGLPKAFSFLAPTIVVIAILTGWFEKLEDVLFNLPTTGKSVTQAFGEFFGVTPSPGLLEWFDSVQVYADSLRNTMESFSNDVLRPLVSLLVNVLLPVVGTIQAMIFIFGQANPILRGIVALFAATEIQTTVQYVSQALGLVLQSLGPISSILNYILGSATFAPIVALIGQFISLTEQAAKQVHDVVGIPEIPTEVLGQAKEAVLSFSQTTQQVFQHLTEVVPGFITDMATKLNNIIVGLLEKLPFGETALVYYQQFLSVAKTIAGPIASTFGFVGGVMLRTFKIIVERFPKDQFLKLGQVFAESGALFQVVAMGLLKYFGKLGFGALRLVGLLINPFALFKNYMTVWGKSLFPLFTPLDFLIMTFRRSISKDVGGGFDILEVKTKALFDRLVPGLTKINRQLGEGTALAGQVTVASLKMDNGLGKLVRSLLWVNAAFQALFGALIVFTLIYLAFKALNEETIESIRNSDALGWQWEWLANTLGILKAAILPFGDFIWWLGKNSVPAAKNAMQGFSYILNHIGKRDIPYLMKGGAPLKNLADTATAGTEAIYLMADKLGNVSIAPSWAVDIVNRLNAVIDATGIVKASFGSIVQVVKIFISIVTIVPVAVLAVLAAVDAVLWGLKLWLIMIRSVSSVTFGVLGTIGTWMLSYYGGIVSALRGDTSVIKELLTRDVINPVHAGWEWLTTQVVAAWQWVQESISSVFKAIVAGAVWAMSAAFNALKFAIHAVIGGIQYAADEPRKAFSNALKFLGLVAVQLLKVGAVFLAFQLVTGNVIGFAVAGVAALVGGLIYLVYWVTTAKRKIDGIGSSVAGAAGAVGSSVEGVNQAVGGVGKGVQKATGTAEVSFGHINRAIQNTIGWLGLLGITISSVLLLINPLMGLIGLGLSLMVSDFHYNFRLINGAIYALEHPIEWLNKAIEQVFNVLTGPLELPYFEKLGEVLSYGVDIFKQILPFIGLAVAGFIGFTFATNKPLEAIGKLLGLLFKGVGVIGLLAKAVFKLVDAFKSLGSPEWQLRFSNALDTIRSAESPFKYQTEQQKEAAKQQLAIQKATLAFRQDMENNMLVEEHSASADLIKGAQSDSKLLASEYKKFVNFTEKERKSLFGGTKKTITPELTEEGQIEVERRTMQKAFSDKTITRIAEENGLIAALEKVGAEVSPDKLRDILSASDPSKGLKAIVDDSRKILEAQAHMQTQNVQEMNVASLNVLGLKGGSLVSPALEEQRKQGHQQVEAARAKAASGPTEVKLSSPLDFQFDRGMLEEAGFEKIIKKLNLPEQTRLGDLPIQHLLALTSALQPDVEDYPNAELSVPILPGMQGNPKLNQNDYNQPGLSGAGSIAELEKKTLALQLLSYINTHTGEIQASGGQIEDIVKPSDILSSTDLLKAIGEPERPKTNRFGAKGTQPVTAYSAGSLETLLRSKGISHETFSGLEISPGGPEVGEEIVSSIQSRLATAHAKDKRGGKGFDNFTKVRNEVVREILEHQLMTLQTQVGQLTQLTQESDENLMLNLVNAMTNMSDAEQDVATFVPKTRMQKLRGAIQEFQSAVTKAFRERVLESAPVKAMQQSTETLQRASQVPARKEQIENVRKKTGVGSDYEFLYRLGIAPQSPVQNLLDEIASGGLDKDLIGVQGLSVKRAQQVISKFKPADLAQGGANISPELDKIIRQKSKSDAEYNQLTEEIKKLKSIAGQSAKALNKTMEETFKSIGSGHTGRRSLKTLVFDVMDEIHNIESVQNKEIYDRRGALIQQVKAAADQTKGQGVDKFIQHLQSSDQRKKDIWQPFWMGIEQLAKVHLGSEKVTAEEVMNYLKGRITPDPKTDPSAVAMQHLSAGFKNVRNPFEQYAALLKKYSGLINDVMQGRIDANSTLKNAVVKYLESQNKTNPADYMEFIQQKTPTQQVDALKMLEKLGLIEELRGNRAAKDYFGVDPKAMSASDEEVNRFAAQMEILQGKFYATDSEALKQAFASRQITQQKVMDAIAEIARLGDLDPAQLIRPDITSEQLQQAKQLRVRKLTALANSQNKSIADLKIAAKDFEAFVSGKFYRVDIAELERIATELGMTAQGSQTVSEKLREHLDTLSILDADKSIGNQIRQIAKRIVTVPLNLLGITALQDAAKYRKGLDASLYELDEVERRLALEQQQKQQQQQESIDRRKKAFDQALFLAKQTEKDFRSKLSPASIKVLDQFLETGRLFRESTEQQRQQMAKALGPRFLSKVETDPRTGKTARVAVGATEQLQALYKSLTEFKEKADPAEQVKMLFGAFDDLVAKKSIDADAKQQLRGTFNKAITQVSPQNQEEVSRAFEQLMAAGSGGMSPDAIASVQNLLNQAAQKGLVQERPAEAKNLVKTFSHYLNVGADTLKDEDLKHLQKVFTQFGVEVKGDLNRVFPPEEIAKAATDWNVGSAVAAEKLKSAERGKIKDSLTEIQKRLAADGKVLGDFKAFLLTGGFQVPLTKFNDEVEGILKGLGIADTRLREIGEGKMTADKFTGMRVNLNRFFEQTIKGVQTNYDEIKKGASNIKLFGLGDKVFKPLFNSLSQQFGSVEKTFKSISDAVNRTRTIAAKLPVVRQFAAAQVAFRSDKKGTLQALVQASGLDTVQNFQTAAAGAIKSKLGEMNVELKEEVERGIWKAILAPSGAGLRSDLMKVTKDFGGQQQLVVDAVLESLGSTLNVTSKEFKSLASKGVGGYATRSVKPFAAYLVAQFPSLLKDINAITWRAVRFTFAEIVKTTGPAVNRLLGQGLSSIGDFFGSSINRLRTTLFPGTKGIGGILTRLEVSVFGLSDTVNKFFEAKAKEIESRGSILSNTLGFIWGGLTLLFGGLVGMGKRIAGFVAGLRPKQKQVQQQVAAQFQTITEEAGGMKIEKLIYPKEIKTAEQRAEFRKRYEQKLAAEEAAALKGSSPIQRAVSAVTEIITRLRRRRDLTSQPPIIPPPPPAAAYSFESEAISPDARNARKLQQQQVEAHRQLNQETLGALADRATDFVDQVQIPRQKAFATEPPRQVRPGETPPAQFTFTPANITPATNVQPALPPAPGSYVPPQAPGLAPGQKAPQLSPVEGAIATKGYKVGQQQGYGQTTIADAKLRTFQFIEKVSANAINPLFSALRHLGESLQDVSRQIELPTHRERPAERYLGRDPALTKQSRDLWDTGPIREDAAGRIFEKVDVQPLTNRMWIAIVKGAQDTAANVGQYFIDAAHRSEGAWGKAGEQIVEGARIDADEIVPRRVRRQVVAYFTEIFLPVSQLGNRIAKQADIAEGATTQWMETARVRTLNLIDVLLQPGKLMKAVFRKGAESAGAALDDLAAQSKQSANEQILSNEQIWEAAMKEKKEKNAAPPKPILPVQDIREGNVLTAVMEQATRRVEKLGLSAVDSANLIESEIAALYQLGLTTQGIIELLEHELKRTDVGEAWNLSAEKVSQAMREMGNTAQEQGKRIGGELNHGSADIVGIAWVREGGRAESAMHQMGDTAQEQGKRISGELNHGSADITGDAWVREGDRAESAMHQMGDVAQVQAQRIEQAQTNATHAIAHTGVAAQHTAGQLGYMGQVGGVFSGLTGTAFKFGGAAMAVGFAAQSASFSLQTMGLISEGTSDRLNKFFEIFSLLSTLGTVIAPTFSAIFSLFGSLGSIALLAFSPISLGIAATVVGIGVLMVALKQLVGIDLITPLRNMLVSPFQQAILLIQSAWQSFVNWMPSRLKDIVMSGVTTGQELVNSLNHGAADVVAAAWQRSTEFIKEQFKKISGLAGFFIPIIAAVLKLVSSLKILSFVRTPGLLSLGTLKGLASMIGSIAVKVWQISKALKTASLTGQVLTTGLVDIGLIVAPLTKAVPLISAFNSRFGMAIKALIQFGATGGNLFKALLGVFGLSSPIVIGIASVAATLIGVGVLISIITGKFDLFSNIIDAVGSAVGRLSAFLKGLISAGSGISTWASNLFAPVQNHLKKATESLSNSFQFDTSNAELIGYAWGTKIFGGIQWAIDKIKSAWTNFSDWFANLPLVQSAIDIGQGLIAALNHSPTIQIPKAWDEAVEKITGFLESLLKLGLTVGLTLVGALSVKQLKTAGTLLTTPAANANIQQRRDARKTKFAGISDKVEKVALYANVSKDIAEIAGIQLPDFVGPLTMATTLVAVLGDLATEVIPLIVTGIRGVGLSIGLITGIAGGAVFAIGAIYFAWKNDLFSIQERTFEAVEAIKSAWTGFSEWFANLPLVQSAIDIAQRLIGALNCHPTEVIPQAWESATARIRGLFDGLGSMGETLGNFLNTVLHPAPELTKNWSGAVDGIKSRVAGIFGRKQPEPLPQPKQAEAELSPELQSKPAVPKWKQWLGLGQATEAQVTQQAEEQVQPSIPVSLEKSVAVIPKPEVEKPAANKFDFGAIASSVAKLFNKPNNAFPEEVQALKKPDNFMPELDPGFGLFGDLGARDRQQDKILNHEIDRIDAAAASIKEHVDKAVQRNVETNAAGFWQGLMMSDKVSDKQLKNLKELAEKELNVLSTRRSKLEAQLAGGVHFDEAQKSFLKSLGIDPEGAEVAAQKTLDFIESVPDKAKEVVAQTGLSLQDRVDYLKTTNGGYIGELFEPGYQQIKQNFGYLAEDAGTFAKEAGAALLRLDFDGVGKAALAFGGNFGAVINGVVAGLGSMGLSAIAAGVFFATSLSPAVLIVGAIALGAVVILTNFLGIRTILRGVVKVAEGFLDILVGVIKTVTDLLGAVYGLGKAFRSAIEERDLAPLIQGFNRIGDAFRNNFPQIIRGFTKVGTGAKFIAKGVGIAANQILHPWKSIVDPLKAIAGQITGIFGRIKASILGLPKAVKAVPQEAKASLERLGDTFNDSVTGGIDKAKNSIASFGTEIRERIGGAFSGLEAKVDTFPASVFTALEQSTARINDFGDRIVGILNNSMERIESLFKGGFERIGDIGVNSFKAVRDYIRNLIPTAELELGEMVTATHRAFEKISSIVRGFGPDVAAILAEIKARIPNVWEGIGAGVTEVTASFHKMMSETLAVIDRMKAAIVEGLGKPLDWIGSKWEGLTGKIRKLLRRTESDSEATGRELISNLAQASPGPTYWIGKRWMELRLSLSQEFQRLSLGARMAGLDIETGFKSAFISIENRAEHARGSIDRLGGDIKAAASMAGAKGNQRKQAQAQGRKPGGERAREGIDKTTYALTSLGAVLSNFAPALAGPLFAVNDFVDAFFALQDVVPALKSFFGVQKATATAAAATQVTANTAIATSEAAVATTSAISAQVQAKGAATTSTASVKKAGIVGAANSFMAATFAVLASAAKAAWKGIIGPLLPALPLILGVTAAVAGLFYLLYSTNLGGFADGINQLWGYLVLFFELLGGGVMDAVGDVFGTLDREIRSIVGLFKDVAGWILKPFLPLFRLFGIEGGGDVITLAIKGTVNAILFPIRLLATMLNGVIQSLGLIIKVVIILGGIVVKVLLSPFELLVNMIRWIFDTAAAGIGFAVNLFKGIFGGGTQDTKSAELPAFASGGLVGGVGSPTGDNKLIWASPGEYVINAAATERYYPLLQAINNSGGGLTAAAPPPTVTPLSPPPLPPDGATPPGVRGPAAEDAGSGDMHFHFHFTGDIVIQGKVSPDESVRAAHEFLDTIDDELESRIVEIFRRRIEFMR